MWEKCWRKNFVTFFNYEVVNDWWHLIFTRPVSLAGVKGLVVWREPEVEVLSLSGKTFVVVRFYREVYEIVEGEKNLKRCFLGRIGVLISPKQR